MWENVLRPLRPGGPCIAADMRTAGLKACTSVSGRAANGAPMESLPDALVTSAGLPEWS